METPIDEQNGNKEEQSSLTPTRESTADIIGGARQTDQLEKLQENARTHKSEHQTTSAAPLEVNDGTQPDVEAASNPPKVEYPKGEEE